MLPSYISVLLTTRFSFISTESKASFIRQSHHCNGILMVMFLQTVIEVTC